MGNLKISQLPIGTPLQGVEDIVIVQNGITAKSNIQEILNYIVPLTLIVAPDEVINLQDVIYEKVELIRMTWNGANGDMTLNLPSASQHPNRVMRFISDVSFANATKVNITPIDPETLDGEITPYVINKSYEGIQIWSDGIEWFIIQKKG
tara:strand:- start:5532 stop:5981 length:450 start_codon:yes stop_codon:yes gene_type:complete